jgi:1-acyl-sn-glycerol-3-phosphate acyltransferase
VLGVPDAEVIPLGTRGKPGRGTGSNKPSSAARNLAGATSTTKSVPTPRAPEDQRPEPEPTLAQTPAAPPEPPAPEAALETVTAPTGGRATSRFSLRDRTPTTGIPVGDWVQALSSAALEVFGERWEQRTAEMLAFLRRRVRGDFEVDEYGFDPEITERFLLAAIRPLKDKWFRVEVRGAENIPAEGGALVVSNHSGTVPVDGLMTIAAVNDETGRHLRPLGADLVFRTPFIGELARKGGATLACNEDAQRMLSGGELVGVWPEGFKGIGKPYSERYKLQRFGRGGFVSAAIRTGVPIVPCSVVGAEEIYPLVGNVPALARLLGIPYLPITPFFPWLGPLGMVPLPSKWLIEFGEPIRTDTYDRGAADDPMLVFNVTDQVRETVQQTLYTLLMQRRSVFY